MSTAALARPVLRRTQATAPIRASFFDSDPDARNSPEALRLRSQITDAYQKSPFRGPPLVLPGGAVLTEDMWASSLDVALDETLDQGMDALRAFTLESWLGHKVRSEGTDDMRRAYEALVASLDAPPTEPADEGFRAGLPADIYTDVVHQPMQEIEVYRGLDDLVLPEGGSEEKPDEEEEEVGDV